MTVAVALGIVAGIVFAWLWLWVVPWAVHGRFFRAMSSMTREILKADEVNEFLKTYKVLLADTARYVGRNFAGAIVAGLPLALIYVLNPVIFQLPFLTAFMATMMIVFCWPRLWPARTAF